MLVKALALTTLLRAASAATEPSVEWGDWKNSGDGQKAMNPVYTWSGIGDKGKCKTKCEGIVRSAHPFGVWDPSSKSQTQMID